MNKTVCARKCFFLSCPRGRDSSVFFVFAILFCCLLLVANASENRLRIYELKHSLAAPVLEVIRPHLPANAGASAVDNKLLLNISDDEYTRLEPILQQLDAAPIRVIVSVRQRDQNRGAEKTLAVDATISNQGSDVAVAKSGPSRSLFLEPSRSLIPGQVDR